MYSLTLKGIFPPLVTPLTDDLELDTEALARLIENALSGRISGIVLLGSIGENAGLTNEIRHQVITAAVGIISKRVPIIVNITSSSYKVSLQMATYACKQGADYIILAPPFYYSMNQAELITYIKMMADRIPVPLILYNVPQYTKTVIEPESVEKLSKHKNIAGIKDSSGDMVRLHEILALKNDHNFSILIGTEMLLGEGVLCGCDGGINGGANIFPELYVKMYEAALKKDIRKMQVLQEWIRKIRKNIYQVADSPMNIIIGLKYALSIKGICSARMAMPVYADLTDHKKKIIKEFINEFEQCNLI
jgi:dihydrodipicolinate synthase/N-acetylneuraminate lyase